MATKQEPCARGTIFVGFRSTARELFGEPGLVAIADHLSPEARHDTIERDVLAVEWLPERHVMGWYDAVHSKLSAQVVAGTNTFQPFRLPVATRPPEAVQGIPGRN